MEDTEAEAVLVALGGRLRWETVQSPLANDTRLCDCQILRAGSYGMEWYTIRRGTKAKPFVAFLDSEMGLSIEVAKCSTLAEAKTACERHYAAALR